MLIDLGLSQIGVPRTVRSRMVDHPLRRAICQEHKAEKLVLYCTSRNASLVHWHDILGGGWHCLHGLEDEQGSK